MSDWIKVNELELISTDLSKEDVTYIVHPWYRESYLTIVKNLFQRSLEMCNLSGSSLKEQLKQDKVAPSNIYAFIGGRGSGKTTAMMEFCSILEKMCKKDVVNWWRLQMPEDLQNDIEKKCSFFFHVINPIDASLLESTEDLFELILIELYEWMHEYLDKEYIYKSENAIKVRDIHARFESVLKMYRAVKRASAEDEISLSFLHETIGSSAKLAEELANLVDKLFSLNSSGRDYEYLVIAVDDLDLNLEHGYEMLEQLQKYFYYHKILIVIAVDYKQMATVCTEHFQDKMKHKNQQDMEEEQYPMHCSDLASQFMTKVFPLAQRIFMPDLKKNFRKVKLISNMEKEENRKSKKQENLNQYIMGKIAETTYIYYDSCGLKRHFCESDTVRDLVTYYRFLYDLNRPAFEKLSEPESLSDEYKKQFMFLYDQNHHRFNQDIKERMARTRLNPLQQKDFEYLLEHDLRRRAQYLIKMALDYMYPESKNDMKKFEEIQEEYTYGRLLEEIYTWGRVKVEDKPLISCLLASFTSEMTREYISCCVNSDERKQQESKKKLLNFIGNTFGSSWIGECFSNNKGNAGYKDKQLVLTSIVISVRQPEIVFKKRTTKTLTEALDRWLKKEQIVVKLECLDMFLIGRKDGNYIGLDFKCEESPVKTRKKQIDTEIARHQEPSGDLGLEWNITIHPELYSYSMILDMMAFVAKSFDFVKQKENLHKNIIKMLTDAINPHCQISKQDIQKIVTQLVEKHSMLNLKEATGLSGVALPFYNLDLSYNIMKRVRQQRHQNDIPQTDIYGRLLKIYKMIEEELSAEEATYGNSVIAFPYVKNFKESPYIHMFRSLKDGEYAPIREMLNKCLESILDNIESLPEHPEAE